MNSEGKEFIADLYVSSGKEKGIVKLRATMDNGIYHMQHRIIEGSTNSGSFKLSVSLLVSLFGFPDHNIIERKFVKTEEILKHLTRKYEVVYKGQAETTINVYLWLVTDLEIPIKIESIDGKWKGELKNIVIGKSQPLF